MTRFQRTSPLPKFLGDLGGEGAPGALELLGLRASEATPARIEAALERQLDRVAQHPEGDTPSADEVRLALHAAAAQLSDPEVRRALVEERAGIAGGGGEARAWTGEGVEDVARSAPRPSYSSGAQESAGVLAEFGVTSAREEADPNAATRKVLLIAGVGGGVLVATLVVLVIMLTSSGGSGSPATTTAGGAGGPAATTTAAAGGGSATTADATEAPDGDAKAGAVAGTTDGSPPAGGPAPPATVKSTRTEYVEASSVVRDLRAATAKAKTDPAAGLKAFGPAAARLSDWWVRYEVGQRRAADDAVVEFLYVVSADKDSSAAALVPLAERAKLAGHGERLGADGVWPAAWAAGLLTRLTMERELPRHLGAGVRAALNEALGAGRAASAASFEAGATAALARMPSLIVAGAGGGGGGDAAGSTEALKRWCDAVAAVTREPADSERLLMDALEQVLIAGPEPESDRGAFEAVELLGTRVRWRQGGAGRERLLAWFADERVTPGDLRVLTGVLAGKSSAEGVDATMVLSITATPDDRVQLRGRYAAAWGLVSSEEKREALAAWRREAQRVLAATEETDDIPRVLAVAGAVRLNEAARLLWLGDATGAAKLLSETPEMLRIAGEGQGPGSVIGAPPPAGGGGGGGGGPGAIPISPLSPRGGGGAGVPGEPADAAAGTWAEAYLKAERNIPVRMQRLQELEGASPPLSPADAALLVEAAYLASPAQVRAAAQKTLGKFADDAGVVKACLDQLPSAPRIRSVAQAIEVMARAPLPRLSDPDWELAARRALVHRLIGMVASGGAEAAIDRAASLIAESYARSSGAGGAGVGPADEGAAQRATRCAGALYKLWRMEAERLPPAPGGGPTPDQIDRRRASRGRIAAGPLQEFAGEQLSVCEVLGAVVAAERPGRAGDVAGVLSALAGERRGADHVLGQMLATERAMTRLWSLRLGEVGL